MLKSVLDMLNLKYLWDINMELSSRQNVTSVCTPERVLSWRKSYKSSFFEIVEVKGDTCVTKESLD